MTALDRQFVQLRFAALLIPLGLLLWLHSASVPVAILLGGMLAAYNGVAALAIRRNAVPRFGKPMAVLLLVLDHLVVTGWILLFASPSSSLPYLLYALVAAEAVFRFELWGGIGTSLFFTSGIILFQTSDLGLAISVRDAILRAVPTVAVITGLGAAVRSGRAQCGRLSPSLRDPRPAGRQALGRAPPADARRPAPADPMGRGGARGAGPAAGRRAPQRPPLRGDRKARPPAGAAQPIDRPDEPETLRAGAARHHRHGAHRQPRFCRRSGLAAGGKRRP